MVEANFSMTNGPVHIVIEVYYHHLRWKNALKICLALYGWMMYFDLNSIEHIA